MCFHGCAVNFSARSGSHDDRQFGGDSTAERWIGGSVPVAP